MTKNILSTEIIENNMGLPLEKLLCEYFKKEEVQDALRDIGEPTTGTKDELIDDLIYNWKSHDRDIYELLDFIDEEALQMICYYYGLDATEGSDTTLKRRIKKANLLEWGEKSAIEEESNDPPIPKIKSKPDTGVTDVHFHFSTIIQSKGGKLGITLAIIGIAVSIIITLVV